MDKLRSSSRSQLPTVVVGGGVSGLSAACVLAGSGRRVHLYERNPGLGGRMAARRVQGWTFDPGPTLLLYPKALERVFQAAGARMEDRLHLVRAEPSWRAFWDGDVRLDVVDDVEQMARRLDAFSPSRNLGDGYRTLIRRSRCLHERAARAVFWRVPTRGSGLRDRVWPRFSRDVEAEIQACLPEPVVARMFQHFLRHVGGTPGMEAVARGALLHMWAEQGLWVPEGGMGAIPEALAALARERGVEIHTGATVERILLDPRGQVRAVRVEGQGEQTVHAVVCAMDGVRAMRELVGGDAGRPYAAGRGPEPSASAWVYLLGLDSLPPELSHHNFILSADGPAQDRLVHEEGQIPEDPTLYVCAPRGGTALTVVVHVPWMRARHDWATLGPQLRRRVLDKLARTAGLVSLESRIRHESSLTPQDFHEGWRVLHGAAWGVAGRGPRPVQLPNRPQVPGLFLAGGATWPGAGVHYAAMSGWIAARQVT